MPEVEAFDYFLTTGIPALITKLVDLQGFSIDHGLRRFGKSVGELLGRLLDDVDRTAVEMAALSEGYIIARIFETHTAKRPITGNLESHIASTPGPFGSVNVGLIDELDKIVNPQGGFGPFWRAQEFGTGTSTGDDRWGDIPQQEGRVIRGVFEPSGAPPDAQQRGLNVGRDLAFVPGGENPGWGTISEELPGRHFLRDGTDEAGAKYLTKMREIQNKYRDLLKGLLSEAQAEIQQRRTFIGRIEA